VLLRVALDLGGDQRLQGGATLARCWILAGIPRAASKTSLPPGPRAPRAVTLAPFVLRPTEFLTRCLRRYGDPFTVSLAADRTVVFTTDPEEIKRLFTGDPDVLHAGEGNLILAPLLGSYSVLLLDGDEHMRQRRLLLPPFHGQRMAAYADTMREAAEREVERWPRDAPFPVLPHAQAITLEVIVRTVFGVRDSARLDRLRVALRDVLDVATTRRRILVLALASRRADGGRAWQRFREVARGADDVLYEEIRARRAGERGGGDDVLSLLLEARHEDGSAMNDEELRDELMTLLVAGHETTATSLAWALERLVRHPQALERLRAEVAEQGAEGEYLDAVVKETLRLRPVVPAVIRRLKAPWRLAGYDLPPGVHVSPSIFLTHRRPDVYPEPDAFRPERFLDAAPGTYTWIPFGGGVRRCLGASFALFEMKVVLETVLRRVEPRPARGAGERVTRRAITFAPARGGRIVVGAA
jgi:cytochrome P450